MPVEEDEVPTSVLEKRRISPFEPELSMGPHKTSSKPIHGPEDAQGNLIENKKERPEDGAPKDMRRDDPNSKAGNEAEQVPINELGSTPGNADRKSVEAKPTQEESVTTGDAGLRPPPHINTRKESSSSLQQKETGAGSGGNVNFNPAAFFGMNPTPSKVGSASTSNWDVIPGTHFHMDRSGHFQPANSEHGTAGGSGRVRTPTGPRNSPPQIPSFDPATIPWSFEGGPSEDERTKTKGRGSLPNYEQFRNAPARNYNFGRSEGGVGYSSPSRMPTTTTRSYESFRNSYNPFRSRLQPSPAERRPSKSFEEETTSEPIYDDGKETLEAGEETTDAPDGEETERRPPVIPNFKQFTIDTSQPDAMAPIKEYLNSFQREEAGAETMADSAWDETFPAQPPYQQQRRPLPSTYGAYPQRSSPVSPQNPFGPSSPSRLGRLNGRKFKRNDNVYIQPRDESEDPDSRPTFKGWKINSFPANP